LLDCFFGTEMLCVSLDEDFLFEPELPELPVEGVLGVEGLVVPLGSAVGAGVVVSEPSGTRPGFSVEPVLLVESAYASYVPKIAPSSAKRTATKAIDDLLKEMPLTVL
jgi:hypothetical protein